MTEQVLMSVIMCLCGNLKPKEAAIMCVENYVNCAVTRTGRILNKTEFDEQCYFQANQTRCLK